MPKIFQKYQKIPKYIEEYRKGKALEKPVPTGEIVYFLRFRFDCGRLHTEEVTGSNPVSPTIRLNAFSLLPQLLRLLQQNALQKNIPVRTTDSKMNTLDIPRESPIMTMAIVGKAISTSPAFTMLHSVKDLYGPANRQLFQAMAASP